MYTVIHNYATPGGPGSLAFLSHMLLNNFSFCQLIRVGLVTQNNPKRAFFATLDNIMVTLIIVLVSTMGVASPGRSGYATLLGPNFM